jgi:hypothetical protein
MSLEKRKDTACDYLAQGSQLKQGDSAFQVELLIVDELVMIHGEYKGSKKDGANGSEP